MIVWIQPVLQGYFGVRQRGVVGKYLCNLTLARTYRNVATEFYRALVFNCRCWESYSASKRFRNHIVRCCALSSKQYVKYPICRKPATTFLRPCDRRLNVGVCFDFDFIPREPYKFVLFFFFLSKVANQLRGRL